jgi:serine/threonine protein kinase
VAILRQVCGSLAEAHGRGLIHRDIKPANIIVSDRGGVLDFVKVLDFGLARATGGERDVRLTGAGDLTGTPLYLAPEAIERPELVDARTDLYALGGVGYFLLTGKPMFEGDSIIDLCMKHVKTAPVAPSQRIGRDVHPILEGIILQCLAKAAADRPESALAFAGELTQCEELADWSPEQSAAWWRDFRTASQVKPGALTPEIAGRTVPFSEAAQS